ncbi:hypothetical protein EJ04DRAFT_579710 [Polyplosphaeria fusca]|uniref:Rhodopsin domain-containing protein n=1 Tax=Polyplosphaeria fusca TaxID=682080 RepID=A0A9P4UZ04_9PLEO|nr:hypothetical protein EJ04DRAFT_579710 [Polyplosphaeria fusca]
MIVSTDNMTPEVILLVIATGAVALRFHARKMSKLGWWTDDWLSLVALVFLAGYMSTYFWTEAHHLSGSDIAKMSIPQTIEILKITFADIYLMSVTITFSRLSIIFLYNRIFGVYDRFRVALWIMGALTMGWVITIIILNTFRCKPIALAYNPLLKGQCLNMTTLFVATESLNCALDLVLVLLPLWRISFLHLSIGDRIGLGFVFLTGGFVCITSILRIVFTYNINTSASGFWLTLQLSFAVICACLPTLRRYLPKHISTPSAVKSYLFSLKLGKTGADGSNDHLKDSRKDSHDDKASSGV